MNRVIDLRLSGIEKWYGDVHAVKGIDLEVRAGEFVVLVGPSGCGKSTLLRIIAGLEEFDDGIVEVGGADVTFAAPKDRNIAMVFQNYALYPYMRVSENLAFPLRMRKVAAAEIERRVLETARILGIETLLDRYPRQLSGGQRQRVAMGRALVRDAKLYLFDEPLSNLDAQLRDDMRTEMKRLHHELGMTMIYVTHDQIEAMTLADRIVLMRDGEIEQMGTPLQLYERPVSRFVAQFIGSPPINLLPVRVGEGASRLRLEDGTELEVSAPTARRWSSLAGRELLLGLRPEHFALAASGRAKADLKGKIDLVEPTGARAYVSFKLGTTRCLAEVSAGVTTQQGQELAFEVDLDRAILVDPETGRSFGNARREERHG